MTIKLRRDSAADWTSNNPTLAEGQPGYETDTGLMKIGDGATAWTSLAYGRLSQPLVATVSGATHAPAIGDGGKYFRCTNAGGCVVTIPANSTQAFPVGTTLTYVQAAAGQVEITQAGGVTVNVGSSHVKFSAEQYAVIQVVKVATDEWDLFGNLEAAP